MKRRPLLLAFWFRWSTSATPAVAAVAGCGPPMTTAEAEEDQKLVQEIVRRQEQRVTQARARVEELERELRLVRMRRRMLERAGRHDLAAAAELEEYGLRVQLASALSAVADEEDALSIYRRRGARGAGGP